MGPGRKCDLAIIEDVRKDILIVVGSIAAQRQAWQQIGPKGSILPFAGNKSEPCRICNRALVLGYGNTLLQRKCSQVIGLLGPGGLK